MATTAWAFQEFCSGSLWTPFRMKYTCTSLNPVMSTGNDCGGASIFHDQSRVEAHPIAEEGALWGVPGLTLSCAELDHRVPTWGFRLQESGSRRMLPDPVETSTLPSRICAKLSTSMILSIIQSLGLG